MFMNYYDKMCFGKRFKEDGEKNACRELCVLEQIFPPRVWTTYEDEENVSTTWRQTISRELPTRRDLTEIINTLYDHERFNNVKNKKLWDEKRGLYKLLFGIIVITYYYYYYIDCNIIFFFMPREYTREKRRNIETDPNHERGSRSDIVQSSQRVYEHDIHFENIT